MNCNYSMAPLENLLHKQHASIPEIWAARATETPDKTFLLYEDKRWTYAQAWDLIRRVSGFLYTFTNGNSSGMRVASFLSNSPEAFWIWFGTQSAGGIYSALNIEHRAQLLESMIERIQPTLLFTEMELLDSLPLDNLSHSIQEIILTDNASSSLPDQYEGISVTSFDEVLKKSQLFFDDNISPFSVANMMFTSGTTGISKAARQPHNMFARGASRAVSAFRLTDTDVVHFWFPMFHIGAQLHFGVAAVLAGASLALFKRFSVSKFWNQVEEYQCSVIGGVTAVFKLIMNTEPSKTQLNASRLRIAVGGPGPSPEMISLFKSRYNVDIYDTYGMTEAEIVTLPPTNGELRNGSVGMVSPDFEVKLINDNREPITTGSTGEILIRPKQPSVLFESYEGMPEETITALHDLWYHTGDLGYFDEDGFLYIRGRKKEVIRRRGENISIQELEMLIRNHPNVKDCAAVGIDSPLGEEDVKVSIVSLDHPTLFDIHAFLIWCSKNMAKFMVPRYIELIEEVPLTNVGKVNRNLLKIVDKSTFDVEQN